MEELYNTHFRRYDDELNPQDASVSEREIQHRKTCNQQAEIARHIKALDKAIKHVAKQAEEVKEVRETKRRNRAQQASTARH